jgi:alanine-synthesizing transaminase
VDEYALIEALCERNGAAIIADEVFGDFPRPGRVAPLMSLVGGARVPTFVLSGLSKVCGMPQMKLGWIVTGGPEAARDEALHGLEWIADLFLSVSTPVQVALPTLLAARGAFQRRMHERLATTLARLDSLIVRRPELQVLPAQGGWAAVLRVPRQRSEEEWALGLLACGVVVHPGHFYDIAGEGYLVLSLIPEPAVFDAAMARIEEFAAQV